MDKFIHNNKNKIIFIILLFLFSLTYFIYVNFNNYNEFIKESEISMAEILLEKDEFVKESLNSAPKLIFLNKQETILDNENLTEGLSSILFTYFLNGFNNSTIGIYSLKNEESVFHLGDQNIYGELNETFINYANIVKNGKPIFYHLGSELIYILPLENGLEGFIYSYKQNDTILRNIQPYTILYMIPIVLILFIFLVYKRQLNHKIHKFAKNVDTLKENNEFLPIEEDSLNEISKSINDLKKYYFSEQEMLYKILDGLPMGIIFYDEEGNIAYINNRVGEITGFSKEEIKELTNNNKILEGENSAFWKALQSGQPCFGYEGFCPIKEGIEIPVMTSTKALYNNQNYFMGTISSFINISEQERLKEVEQHAKVMLDHITDGIIRVDKDGIINGFNNGAETMTGLKKKEVVGKKYDDIFIKTKSIFTKLTLTLKTGKEYNLKKEIITDDAKKRYLMITTKILNDENNNKIGAIGVYKDITEIEELNYRVQRADKLAVVGELAAGTAHEIRNPLTAIQGFIQLLGEKTIDDNNLLYINLILDEIGHINEIISEMLLLAKPSNPIKVLININKVINEIILFMDSESALNNVKISTMLDEGAPDIEIDKRQIKQVFINILTNAIQSMKNGGNIDVFSGIDNDKQMLEIKFVDTGEGIPEEKLQKIYEPFFTTKEKGTGLGIPVSFQIMKNHGGDMEILSIAGKGTTIILSFPLFLNDNMKNG